MSEPVRNLDPRLVARLDSLRGRIRRLAWMHGVGTWLLAVALLLVTSFYLDRFLNPPHAMRLVVAPIVWLAVLVGFAWWVVRRARVRVTADDAALLVERNNPELKERLISALELARDARGAEPVFVARAIEEGEEAASRVEFARAVRPGGARLRAFGGLVGVGVCVTMALREPGDTAVFFQRLLGLGVEFPQRTHLDLDIPTRSANVMVERKGDEISVRIARGADLAVRALATGDAPDLVEIVTNEGRRIPMGRSGLSEYLARFHGVKTNFEFHAEGGDDRDGTPIVRVVTVTPPAIARIRAHVTPPDYSAQRPFDREGGSFEALVGSMAEIAVETTTPVRRATLRFRGTDETIEFRSREVAGDASSRNSTKLSCEFRVEKNVRYTVELEDGEGLRNPDPGSYSVVALTDRPPEAKLQAPARTEVDLSPTGTLALQARASDDFGVTALRLRIRVGSQGPFESVELPLATLTGEPVASAPAPDPNNPPATHKSVVARLRLDLASLHVRKANETPNGAETRPGAESERPLAERDSIELYVEAADTRSPQANTGESLHVRGSVMAPADILKRITDRFTRAKETVQSLLDIQNERRRRVAELLSALSPSEGSATKGSDRTAITSILVGQNRVTTDSRVLVREFFECLETAASNRLDRTGEAVSGALDRLRLEIPAGTEDPYSPEVARALITGIRSGALGSPEFLTKLADMLGEAAAIATESSPGASSALDAANLGVDAKATTDALARAQTHQDAAIRSLEKLLGMLAEWANFQDVITLTKEIVDQQKTLKSKTKDATTPKGSK